jgi:hypothetical protein
MTTIATIMKKNVPQHATPAASSPEEVCMNANVNTVCSLSSRRRLIPEKHQGLDHARVRAGVYLLSDTTVTGLWRGCLSVTHPSAIPERTLTPRGAVLREIRSGQRR